MTSHEEKILKKAKVVQKRAGRLLLQPPDDNRKGHYNHMGEKEYGPGRDPRQDEIGFALDDSIGLSDRQGFVRINNGPWRW